MRRLLIIDNDADTRDLMVRLLSSSYELSVADGYDTALARADEARPDVVVSDIGLGGRDGLALMAELKRRYDVPGVAVSGHVLEPRELRNAGFVGYLRKPIRWDDLLKLLDEATFVRPMSAATSL
jgi:two-component system response regulator GlrR